MEFAKRPDVMGNEPMSIVDRRGFIKATVVGAATAVLAGDLRVAPAAEASGSAPETLVKILYDSFSDVQRSAVCFDWGHVDDKRGLLRTRIANNWQITDPTVSGDYFTKEQQHLIRQIFEGIIRPDWHERIDRQLRDDAGGFGQDQAIAIFGQPGSNQFEFVMTGRHMTLRCDGNTAEHVAFGGPIFYGHDPHGSFDEGPKHEDNVFWPQALEANRVYGMLDERQRRLAEVPATPAEQRVAFRGPDGTFLGIPVTELSSDQKEAVQGVLQKLIEPYRQVDQDEVLTCLKSQGGLDKCHLAFFTDHDIGQDRVWDNWRLEGPSFVWHFRGSPHVHVWVNVADQARVELNA